MSKVFFKILDNFLRKELDGYKFVYLTTDLRGLLKKYYPMSANELSKQIIKCLLKNKLTILIPAYSYTTKGIFLTNETKSNLSFLTKWALKKKFFRTSHPIFSVCVIGQDVKYFHKIGKAAFGRNSFWEKLMKNKSSLLHIGRPFSLGNTIIHYVENNVDAKYRFHKVFPTRVFKYKKYLGKNFSAFVQRKTFQGKKIDTDTKKISKLISRKNFYKKIGKDNNFTNITHIDLKRAYNFMYNSFEKNNRIFIRVKK